MGWVLTKSLDRKAEILVTFTASLCNIPEYAGNAGSLLEPIKRASGSACHVGQRRFCRSAMSGRLFMADGWPASQDRRTTPYGNRGWPKTCVCSWVPTTGRPRIKSPHTPGLLRTGWLSNIMGIQGSPDLGGAHSSTFLGTHINLIVLTISPKPSLLLLGSKLHTFQAVLRTTTEF
jgi:hypothetical protein